MADTVMEREPAISERERRIHMVYTWLLSLPDPEPDDNDQESGFGAWLAALEAEEHTMGARDG